MLNSQSSKEDWNRTKLSLASVPANKNGTIFHQIT